MKFLNLLPSDPYSQVKFAIAIRVYSSLGLPIVHHEGYEAPLPKGHRFPMTKFTRVFQHLVQDSIVQNSNQVFKPKHCSWDTLRLVHTPEYLKRLVNLSLTSKEIRRVGLPLTKEVISRCLYETGGTLLAAQLAMEYGLACSTAGGTHHAHSNFGAGFCVLNDLALTAKYFCVGKQTKVLIIDLDVHQGDGTAEICKGLKNIYTFSMHCEKNFPVHKQPSDLDISLEPGLIGKEYLHLLRYHLPSILDSFKPSLVLYDAGVDPHIHDILGKLNLTDHDLFARDLYVLTEVCIKRKYPCATVIGGGYSNDIRQLAKRHTIVHRAANYVWNMLS